MSNIDESPGESSSSSSKDPQMRDAYATLEKANIDFMSRMKADKMKLDRDTNQLECAVDKLTTELDKARSELDRLRNSDRVEPIDPHVGNSTVPREHSSLENKLEELSSRQKSLANEMNRQFPEIKELLTKSHTTYMQIHEALHKKLEEVSTAQQTESRKTEDRFNILHDELKQMMEILKCRNTADGNNAIPNAGEGPFNVASTGMSGVEQSTSHCMDVSEANNQSIPSTSAFVIDVRPRHASPTKSSSRSRRSSIASPPAKRTRGRMDGSVPTERRGSSVSNVRQSRKDRFLQSVEREDRANQRRAESYRFSEKNRDAKRNQSVPSQATERSRAVPSTSTFGTSRNAVSQQSGRKRAIGKKEESANPEALKMFCRFSSLWYGTQLLKSHVACIKSERKNVKSGALNKVETFIHKCEDENPLNVGRKEFEDTQLALDRRNYRKLDDYRREMTCSTVDEIKPAKVSRMQAKPSIHQRWPFLVEMSEKASMSAEEIIHAADRYTRSGENVLYREKQLVPPEVNTHLMRKEFDYYKSDNSSGDFENLRLAVPTLQLKSKDHLYSAEVRKFCKSHPISLLRDLQKTSGIDGSLFTLEALFARNPNQEIDAVLQVPQSVNFNFNSEGQESWECPTVKDGKKKTIRKFFELHNEQKILAEKLFEAVLKVDLEQFEETILNMMDEERAKQGKRNKLLWKHFGTNIDLFEQTNSYQDQYHELMNKLPVFLRPRSRKNILSFAGNNVLGVNTAQLYAKLPGARTAAHMENLLVRSINHNFGPDPCIWFAVTYEHWGQLVDLVDKNHKKGSYHKQNYWPNEMELLQAGIPIFKFEQKADETVYVNTGTFHWVQSQGFCTNIAWNEASSDSTQLSTSIISAQHNVGFSHRAIIPLRNIIVNVAKHDMYKSSPNFQKIVKQQLAIMLFNSRHCENLLNEKNANFKPARYSSTVSPTTCDICQGEVALIVHYKWSKNKRFEYCMSCNLESVKGRKDSFETFCSVDELKKIYERWADEKVLGDSGFEAEKDGFMNPDNNSFYELTTNSYGQVPGTSSSTASVSNPEVRHNKRSKIVHMPEGVSSDEYLGE